MLLVRLDGLTASARLESHPGGEALLACRHRIHRPREALLIYPAASPPLGADASEPAVLMTMRRRAGMWAAYDVRLGDETGATIGMIRRRGVGTPAREVWDLTAADGEAAELRSSGLAAAPGAIARAYRLTAGGEPAGVFHRRYSPLHVRLELDFSADPGGRFDRRLSLAAAFLMALGSGALRR